MISEQASECVGSPFCLLTPLSVRASHLDVLTHMLIVLHSGANIRQVKREDAGAVLADTLRQFLFDLQVEDGLEAVGYTKDDIPALVKGTIPQVCSRSP